MSSFRLKTNLAWDTSILVLSYSLYISRAVFAAQPPIHAVLLFTLTIVPFLHVYITIHNSLLSYSKSSLVLQHYWYFWRMTKKDCGLYFSTGLGLGLAAYPFCFVYFTVLLLILYYSTSFRDTHRRYQGYQRKAGP